METIIIERNYFKFNYRTRNYRTYLVNVRNMTGTRNYGTQTKIIERQKRYE